MKSAARVLLIGRHFWPHGSFDSTGSLVQLACGLDRRGLNVEVCTPRYAASWPEKFWFREIPVHRPAAAPRSDWSMGRYTRHLTTWLRQNVASYDVMLVDAIREEAIAAIEATRSTQCACVLQYSGWGSNSDSHFWNTSRAARRCSSIGRLADTVVAKSSACNRALLAERFSADRVVRIPPGFVAKSPRTNAERTAARKSLASINSDLRTDSDSPVAICHASMTRQSGIEDLARATRHLINDFPDLRVWFIGDGPHRDWIYDQLKGDGVRASIAMPGSFSHLDELYAAADFYLQVDDFGLDYLLPQAVAAELPIIALATESVRNALVGSSTIGPLAAGSLMPSTPTPDSIIAGSSGTLATEAESTYGEGPADWVRWLEKTNAKDVRAAVADVMGDLPGFQKRAGQLRRYWQRARPITATLDSYMDLIEQMIIKKGSNRHGQSTEALS